MSSAPRNYPDVPSYVLGVTREIWEERRISSLEHYYGKDIVVRSPASVVLGNGGIIAATLATLHEFPDRQLYGEDVIWCDAPHGCALSSHRLMCTATHLAEGVYGPPTGKTLAYRIIAECHIDGTVINDEWLVRDQGAIVRQLGMSRERFAGELIEKEGGAEHCVRPYTQHNDVTGPYTGSGNASPIGHLYADTLSRIMAGELSVVSDVYDRAAQLSYAGGVETHSHGGADAFWLGLRAAFPSGAFKIHHAIGREDPGMPPRAALRWSLEGRHDGWGAFGRPTGAQVFVMGMCQAEFGSLDGAKMQLRREWALYDETAVWKQILLGR